MFSPHVFPLCCSYSQEMAIKSDMVESHIYYLKTFMLYAVI